jgi:outer membrane protein assembly factor BamB
MFFRTRTRIRNRQLLLVSIGLVVATAAAQADDWPRWRGPQGNQISTEKAWEPEALSSPRVVWEVQIGKGHSSFAIKDRRLFTTGNRSVVMASGTVFEEIIFCLDAGTGHELWRHAYPSPEGDAYVGPEGTPFVDGDRVYAVGRDGHLFCLDKASGQVLWQRHLQADELTKVHGWGVSSSPVVEGDLLLLNVGASGAAFNKHSGEIVWRSPAETCGFASPVVFTHEGRRLAAMQGQETLSFVDVKSGEVTWSYPWNSYQDAIVLGDRLLLTGGRDGKVKGSALIAWTEEEPRVLWSLKRAEAAFQGWVVIADHAYGFFRSRSQKFRCMNLGTGEIVWEENLGMWGSFMVADGKLLIITGAGEMIIAEATPEAFKVISRAQALECVGHGDDVAHGRRCFIWTHPVLSNGLLYVRNTDGDLVCIDLRS